LPRYFIQLSFKGTNFHGWQKQENAFTVQEELEKAISILLRKETEVIGAGRTDTGVHASYYIAHFDCELIFENDIDFIYHLNRILPLDIAIQNIRPVKDDAHARFSALSRTYEYKITTEKNPFEQDFSLYFPPHLDIEKLNIASKILYEHEDFTSFCKLHGNNVTNNCKVMEAVWLKQEGNIVFRIKADRFLRNMVRAIVGTLLKVGTEKISVEEFRKIIELKNRNKAGTSAPAHGLYLTAIEYPENLYI
jgi:tRNA pseudouridine38-40 synthase